MVQADEVTPAGPMVMVHVPLRPPTLVLKVKPVGGVTSVTVVPEAMQLPDTCAPGVMPFVHVTLVTAVVEEVPVTVMMLLVLPSVGKEPAGTTVHALLPLLEVKVPAGQGVQ